jgi:hypothetical protein
MKLHVQAGVKQGGTVSMALLKRFTKTLVLDASYGLWIGREVNDIRNRHKLWLGGDDWGTPEVMRANVDVGLLLDTVKQRDKEILKLMKELEVARAASSGFRRTFARFWPLHLLVRTATPARKNGGG